MSCIRLNKHIPISLDCIRLMKAKRAARVGDDLDVERKMKVQRGGEQSEIVGEVMKSDVSTKYVKFQPTHNVNQQCKKNCE